MCPPTREMWTRCRGQWISLALNLGARMFFIWIGNVIAWVGLIFGSLRLGVGFYVAMQNDASERAALARRYLGSTSSGEAIDQALRIILVAVAFGILVKIASILQRMLWAAETD